MLYLDSSLVVALLVKESHSARVDAWMTQREKDSLAVSNWVTVEVAAALAAKVRLGLLDDDLMDEAFSTYLGLRASTFRSLRLGQAEFEVAARMARHKEAKLRGADALHLAVAQAGRARLCTLDKRQAAAGEIIGVETELI